MWINTQVPVVGGAPGASVPAGSTPVGRISGAGAPTDGVTGAGISAPGDFYYDTTNKQLYINEGSSAVPAWHMVIEA